MAEDVLVAEGAAADPTPEERSDSRIQSSGLDEASLRQIVREENSAFWGAIDRRLTPFEQRAALLDEVPRLVEALSETNLSVRQQRALLQRFAKGSMTSEDYATLEEGVKQSLDEEGTRAELERLRKQEQARKATAEAEAVAKAEPKPAGRTPAEQTDADWRDIYLPRVEEILEDNGLPANALVGKLPIISVPDGRTPTPAEWRQFLVKVKALAAEEAVSRQKAAQPRTNVASERPAGGGGGNEFDKYIKALREGGPLPSPEEIDRITAARYQ